MASPPPKDATPGDRTSALRSFGNVFEALDLLPLPVFAIRKDGTIRWLNLAAERVLKLAHKKRMTTPVPLREKKPRLTRPSHAFWKGIAQLPA